MLQQAIIFFFKDKRGRASHLKFKLKLATVER